MEKFRHFPQLPQPELHAEPIGLPRCSGKSYSAASLSKVTKLLRRGRVLWYS